MDVTELGSCNWTEVGCRNENVIPIEIHIDTFTLTVRITFLLTYERNVEIISFHVAWIAFKNTVKFTF